MKYTNEAAVRDYVAQFILSSASDADCLTESIADLWEDSELDDEEWEAESDAASNLAWDLFDRAQVTVTIDGVEYGN